MSERVEMCRTCPARGACAGEVELDIRRVELEDTNRYDSIPGFKLLIRDGLGVEATAAVISPETHSYKTPFTRRHILRATHPRFAGYMNLTRSNNLTAMAIGDPEGLITAVAERMTLCDEPGRNVCGGLDPRVLSAIGDIAAQSETADLH